MSAKKNGSTIGTLLVLLLFFGVFAISIWQMQYQDEQIDAAIESPMVPTLAPQIESSTAASPRRSQRSTGWRQVNVAAVPGGIDVFSSGNVDTFRGRRGPYNFHINGIDRENFGLTYTSLNDEAEKTQFASLRFCRRLSFMGNPQVDELLQVLQTMPAPEPLSSGAQPMSESQQDAGFVFSELCLDQDANGKLFRGKLTNTQKKRIEQAAFYLVLVDPTDKSTILSETMILAESMLPNVPQPFQTAIVGSNKFDEPLVKIWLELTSANRSSRSN